MRLQKSKPYRRQNRLFSLLSSFFAMILGMLITRVMFYLANPEEHPALLSLFSVSDINTSEEYILSPTETKYPPDDQRSELVGPDFSLSTLDDTLVSLSDFRGQVVLINFWASWCTPCRQEMPAIQMAYKKYRSDGFVVLGINMTHQDNLQNAKVFAKEYGVTFPILLDKTGEVTDRLYRVMSVPTSIFINKDGVISRSYLGMMNDQQIDAFIQELIGVESER